MSGPFKVERPDPTVETRYVVDSRIRGMKRVAAIIYGRREFDAGIAASFFAGYLNAVEQAGENLALALDEWQRGEKGTASKDLHRKEAS